jgi:DNA-binding MarR family transcriptional regulator
MDELQRFGFVLKDVARSYVARFEQRASALRLTLSQCRVLVYLAVNEGVSQSRLCELTEIEPMNLVRILDRMEAKGWLERRADPIDRRARKLYMKPKAKPLVDNIWAVAAATRAEAFQGMSRDESKQLFSLLKRMSENLLALKPFAPVAAATVSRPSRAKRLHAVDQS